MNPRKLQSIVDRGAIRLKASQLLLPLRGALRGGRHAADGSRNESGARFTRSLAARTGFDALKLAVSSGPVLCSFDPARTAAGGPES